MKKRTKRDGSIACYAASFKTCFYGGSWKTKALPLMVDDLSRIFKVFPVGRCRGQSHRLRSKQPKANRTNGRASNLQPVIPFQSNQFLPLFPLIIG